MATRKAARRNATTPTSKAGRRAAGANASTTAAKKATNNAKAPARARRTTEDRRTAAAVPDSKRPGPKQMSAEHRQALQTGRDETKTVRAYMEALEAHKPKRGRKRDPERIRRRITEIDETLPTSDPLTRVHLLQERTDLGTELDGLARSVDLSALEESFVAVVGSYSQRRGISAATWQAAGVPAQVVRRGGVR